MRRARSRLRSVPDGRFAHVQGRGEHVLCTAARLPIFWQFVGLDDDFAFLRKLDDLPVPQRRVVDNAPFFAAGPSPRSISDADLYDRLLHEFPQWLTAARAAGIALSR